MTTFPTEFRPVPYGVVLALYPTDSSASTEVQRAPDSSGDPDTGSTETVAIVEPGRRTHTDIVSGGIWHYRVRHVRPGATASAWTAWVAASTVRIPSELPNIPKLRDPVISIDEDSSADESDITVTVEDPDRLLSEEPEFATKVGPGAYGSFGTGWDSDTGTAGEDKVLTREVTVTKSSKHSNAFKGHISWVDDGGEEQEEIRPHALDSDNIAEVDSLSGYIIASTGEVVVDIGGDIDLATAYITVGEDSEPADPNGSGNEDATLNARSGIVETGVIVAVGATAHVKVRGENSEGTLAPTSAIKEIEIEYPEEGQHESFFATLPVFEGGVIVQGGENNTVLRLFSTGGGHMTFHATDGTQIAAFGYPGSSNPITMATDTGLFVDATSGTGDVDLRAGGTGRFRANDNLFLFHAVDGSGNLILNHNQLPTSDPGVLGAVWNNTGLLAISDGT